MERFKRFLAQTCHFGLSSVAFCAVTTGIGAGGVFSCNMKHCSETANPSECVGFYSVFSFHSFRVVEGDRISYNPS